MTLVRFKLSNGAIVNTLEKARNSGLRYTTIYFEMPNVDAWSEIKKPH